MKWLIYTLLFLVMGCSEQDVYTTKSTVKFIHSKDIIKASALSDNGVFNIVSDNQSVCVWQITKPKSPINCLSAVESEFITIVGISKNNQYFFTSNQVSVNLYTLLNGEKVGQWQVGDHIINDIDISANGDKMLLGFRSGKASIIETESNKITTYDKHRLDINSVSLSDNGELAFTGSSDKFAMFWVTNTGKNLQQFKHGSRVNHVKLSADGLLGFTLDAIKDRNFWDLTSGKLHAALDTNLRFFEFNDSAFSQDNAFILSGSPRQVLQVWRVSNGALIAQYQSEVQHGRASVLSVSFNDKKHILTTNSDGIVEQWPLPVSLYH